MAKIALISFALSVSVLRAQVAYVGASSDDVISTLDESTGAQGAIARAGYYGVNVAVSPDGTKAYVQEYGAGITQYSSLVVVDLATAAVTGRITAVDSPGRPALSVDGARLYAFSYADGTVAEIDAASGNLLASVSVGYLSEETNQGYITVKPDGSEVYVATADALLALDSRTLDVEATIPVQSEALAFSPDGTLIYAVSNHTGTMLSVIDTESHAVVASVRAPAALQDSIEGLAVSPDGQTIYISAKNRLLAVSASSFVIQTNYRTPGMGASLAVSQDGAAVYATRFYGAAGSYPFPGLVRVSVSSGAATLVDSGSVFAALCRPSPNAGLYGLSALPSILIESPASGAIGGAVRPSLGSTALAVSSSGNVVAGLTGYDYNAANPHVSVSLVDTSTHKSAGAFNVAPFNPLGEGLPYGISLNRDGSVAYLAAYNGSGASVIEALKLPQGTVENTFPVSAGFGIGPLVVSPDDSTLYFSETNEICSYKIANPGADTCASTAAGKGFGNPGGYTLSPDGSTLYLVASTPVADGFGALLYVDAIDANTLATATSIPIPYSDIGPAPYTRSVAFAPGSNSVYITCELEGAQPFSGAILRVDLATSSVSAVTHFGYIPIGLAVTPDGTKALVTGSNVGTQIFDGTTLAPAGLIPGGPSAGIVIAPQ